MARINRMVSKPEGRSPHGHRHAYGRRLSNAGIDPVLIKKALHHSSLLSQSVYTQPGIRDVSNALEAATEQLEGKQHVVFREDVEFSWQTVMEHVFSDIDPDRIFTGRHPKFKRPSQ